MRVLLLGPFAARDGKGTEVVLPKKAQALAGFLLMAGGRETARDDLSALLWSHAGSEQARQSLRQCLSVLRRTLLGTSLAPQGEKIALKRDEKLTSDLYEWEQLRQSDSLADLCAGDLLHRGEFLAGLSLPHEPFEDWAANERRRFMDGRQNLLTRLAILQARADDLAAAVTTARRLVALDPFRETSRRLLMELLTASGERGLALLEHARVERLLREELQVSPEPVTWQLAEKMRRGQPVHWQWLRASTHLAPPDVATNGRSGATTVPRQHVMFPDRPTIAMRPFLNLTGDPAEGPFVQAVTEDVASALVRERWPLSVLAPAHHRNEPTPGNARYLVGGSLRRDARRARAVVHLTDAAQGRQLWSAQVDAETDGLFALHDQLCQQIVSRLASAIRMAETQRTKRHPIEELSAYELYLRAQAACRRGPKGNETALRLLRRAVELDPELGVAHALSARCLHLQRTMGWMHPEEPRLYDALRSAHEALEIDETNPEALWMAGLAFANIGGDLIDGQHLVDRSLTINPNDASAWIASSFVRALSGDPETAIQHFHRAQQVNPDDGSQHVQWHAAATAYFVAERYVEADAAADRALAERPGYHGSLKVKVAASALLGRIDRAQHAARKLLIVNPDSSIATVRSYWRFWAPTRDAAAAMVDGWRRAGMPEG